MGVDFSVIGFRVLKQTKKTPILAKYYKLYKSEFINRVTC